jgi:hypothetical protein
MTSTASATERNRVHAFVKGTGLSDFALQSDKNVSRETFWSDRGPKPYKAQDSGPTSILYDRSLFRGGTISIERPVAKVASV